MISVLYIGIIALILMFAAVAVGGLAFLVIMRNKRVSMAHIDEWKNERW